MDAGHPNISKLTFYRVSESFPWLRAKQYNSSDHQRSTPSSGKLFGPLNLSDGDGSLMVILPEVCELLVYNRFTTMFKYVIYQSVQGIFIRFSMVFIIFIILDMPGIFELSGFNLFHYLSFQFQLIRYFFALLFVCLFVHGIWLPFFCVFTYQDPPFSLSFFLLFTKFFAYVLSLPSLFFVNDFFFIWG